MHVLVDAIRRVPPVLDFYAPVKLLVLLSTHHTMSTNRCIALLRVALLVLHNPAVQQGVWDACHILRIVKWSGQRYVGTAGKMNACSKERSIGSDVYHLLFVLSIGALLVRELEQAAHGDLGSIATKKPATYDTIVCGDSRLIEMAQLTACVLS